MQIKVNITREDYANFNNYYFLKKGLKKRMYIVIIVAFVLPLVVTNIRPFDLLVYLRTVILAGLIFGIFYLGAMTIAMKITGFLPSKDGSLLGEKTFIISDDGLIEECESNTNLQKWKGIKSVESNDKSVFIFVDKIAAYVIPKRYFKDAEEQTKFINLIESRINKSA